jgi:hypothetical protein
MLNSAADHSRSARGVDADDALEQPAVSPPLSLVDARFDVGGPYNRHTGSLSHRGRSPAPTESETRGRLSPSQWDLSPYRIDRRMAEALAAARTAYCSPDARRTGIRRGRRRVKRGRLQGGR